MCEVVKCKKEDAYYYSEIKNYKNADLELIHTEVSMLSLSLAQSTL